MPIATSKTAFSPPPAKKTAPKQGTAAASKSDPVNLSPDDIARRRRRAKTLGEFSDLISGGLSVFGLEADAGAVRHHGSATIIGLTEYAETNETFAKWIDGGDQVSPIIMVFASCLALGTQIAVNHGLFGMKAERFSNIGVVSPETLVSENRSAMMKAQQAALEIEMRDKANLMRTMAEHQRVMQQYSEMERQLQDLPAQEFVPDEYE